MQHIGFNLETDSSVYSWPNKEKQLLRVARALDVKSIWLIFFQQDRWRVGKPWEKEELGLLLSMKMEKKKNSPNNISREKNREKISSCAFK